MAITTGNVRTAPSGNVWLGPLGTPEPATPTDALDAALFDLGCLTPDGVSITPNVESEDIMIWQSLSPVLSPITGFVFEISFTMAEVNQKGLGEFFAGSTWTNSGGAGRLDIDSNPGTQERLLVVEWVDNREYNYRLVVPRAQMTNREAMNLVRGDSINSGLSLKALDDDGIAAYILSNNPALIPAT